MAIYGQFKVLSSGKATYKLQLPYRLIESGPQKTKPFILWLHGFGQHLEWMQQQIEPVMEKIPAFHLIAQAPFLLTERYLKSKKEGYSWYLFGGDKEQYQSSMEHAAEYLFELISRLKALTNAQELWICGYSQGAYLAGFMTLHRPERVNACFMLAGRLKHEWAGDWKASEMCRLTAIHGSEDKEVLPGPQIEALEFAKKQGVLNVQMHVINGGHEWSAEMTETLYRCMAESI